MTAPYEWKPIGKRKRRNTDLNAGVWIVFALFFAFIIVIAGAATVGRAVVQAYFIGEAVGK